MMLACSCRKVLSVVLLGQLQRYDKKIRMNVHLILFKNTTQLFKWLRDNVNFYL